MATIAMTGCEVSLGINQLAKVVTTPFLGTAGITISSVKFEDDTGPATYLTTNGAGQRTLYLNIRGVNPSTGDVNQEVQIKVYPIVNTGPGIGKALGTISNPSPTTVFTGNVQLVLVISAAVGAETGFIGKAKVTFTYETYKTKCTAPTSVTVTRTRNSCKVSWSGAAGGTNNAISGYGVRWWYDDGSTDGVYGTIQTKTSTATSSNYTFTGLASRTYQFGVRTQGAAGSSYYSDWAWSANVTVPQKPSVTAGTVITDTQMDNLRTWINTSGITNIADATQVKATEGNTYKSGLTAGTTSIEASWYNSAADG